MNPLNFYEQQITIHTQLLDSAKKKHRALSFARLIAFLSMPISWYVIGWSFALLVTLLVEIVVFIFLVNKWLDAKLAKEREELFIALNRKEIALLSGDWSAFDDGVEFKTSQHPFAHDMDLFGPKSVYQYINRTVLPLGKKRLADTLAFGAKNRELNQIMIEELANHRIWSQNFIVESKVYLKDENRQKSLSQLKDMVFKNGIAPILKWILPIISLCSIILYNLDLITGGMLLLIGIIVLTIIGTKVKYTNQWMNLLSERSEKMHALAKQLELFNDLQLDRIEAINVQKELVGENGMKNGLKELISLRKRAEYRMNAIVGLLLNYLFAWDFHLLDASKKWLDQYGSQVDNWEVAMAEIEVWISGAIYKYNRGETCFAKINDQQLFEINQLSHPFVAVSKQVSNDFTLLSENSFLIITGPNMAGKSTYLRSVGLAIISANAGFPVLAQSCTLPAVELYSSMRTSDDLTVESSYFHAELTRLRYIVDAIDEGKKVFVILDEILKGTNSKDKEEGSAAFMEKLNRIGAKGIIATHDLSLTNLSASSSSFKNVYFDSTIEGENLSFDYKMRWGICQNMNASFLLRKMQLV